VEPFAIMMVFLGIPAILAWTYRTSLSHQRFMKILQLKAEMNARLIDRAGSDPAVLEVLTSEAQQRMFEIKVPELEPRMPAAISRVLTSAQIGIVLLCAGGGLLYIRRFLMESGGVPEVLLVFGTLGAAIGIGALLSAVAAFVVARFWQAGNGTEPANVRG
jgi:hypothetical protein